MGESSYRSSLTSMLDYTVTLTNQLHESMQRVSAARGASEAAKGAVRGLEQQWEAAEQDELMRQMALTKLRDKDAVMTAGDAAGRKQQFEAHIGAMALNPDSQLHSIKEALEAAKLEEVRTGLELSEARDHFTVLQSIVDLRKQELASLTQLVAGEIAMEQQEAYATQVKLMALLYDQANLKIQGVQNVGKSDEPNKH